MTPEEATEHLRFMKDYCASEPEDYEAFDIAIDALETRNARRALEKEALTPVLTSDGSHHPPRQDGSGSSRDFPASQVRDIPEGWVMVPKPIPYLIYNDMLAAQHNTLLRWGRTSFELNLPITAQTASRALEAALAVLYAASPPAPEMP